MTQLEVAKLALEMIAFPRQQGAGPKASDPKYLQQIAQIALCKMIKAEYAPKGKTILSEIGL